MRKRVVRGLFLLAAVAVISSCATVPVAQRERGIMRVVDLINNGSVEDLVSLSRVPFVLDREIIALGSDIQTMWTNLRKAGFTLPDARIADITPVTADTYKEFGNTMDMRVYFDKYLAKDGTVVRLQSGNGTFLLLLGDRRWFTPELFGIKGPVQ